MVELAIVVSIVGVAIYIARVGILFINNLYYRTALVQAQQEAELNLYNITRDVRNSKVIVEISSGTLTLNTFNPHLGFDVRVNPVIFSPVNIATMTYQFVQNGSDSYLQKTVITNGQAVVTRSLRNILSNPVGDNYLFRSYNGANSPNPQAVDIAIRLDPNRMHGNNFIFTMTTMKRTRD